MALQLLDPSPRQMFHALQIQGQLPLTVNDFTFIPRELMTSAHLGVPSKMSTRNIQRLLYQRLQAHQPLFMPRAKSQYLPLSGQLCVVASVFSDY